MRSITKRGGEVQRAPGHRALNWGLLADSWSSTSPRAMSKGISFVCIGHPKPGGFESGLRAAKSVRNLASGDEQWDRLCVRRKSEPRWA